MWTGSAPSPSFACTARPPRRARHRQSRSRGRLPAGSPVHEVGRRCASPRRDTHRHGTSRHLGRYVRLVADNLDGIRLMFMQSSVACPRPAIPLQGTPSFGAAGGRRECGAGWRCWPASSIVIGFDRAALHRRFRLPGSTSGFRPHFGRLRLRGRCCLSHGRAVASILHLTASSSLSDSPARTQDRRDPAAAVHDA